MRVSVFFIESRVDDYRPLTERSHRPSEVFALELLP